MTEVPVNIGSPIEIDRVQGESNWEKTGVVDLREYI